MSGVLMGFSSAISPVCPPVDRRPVQLNANNDDRRNPPRLFMQNAIRSTLVLLPYRAEKSVGTVAIIDATR